MLIKDLHKELDAKSMTAVRGGDNGTSAASNLLQAMGIDAPVDVGYGAGSAGNTFVHVDGSQSGDISNHQTSGDKFSAFLGTLKRL
jgi:predicted ATPase